MEKIKIHIVSFQFPYPANYGGVIDVYYKLKALSEAGFSITFHSFLYDRPFDKVIMNVVDRVYLYPRNRKWSDLLSCIPFIVKSRKSDLLLENLCEDQCPIFFEGLHSCYLLSHPKLRSRIKLFRAHNVEHRYYYRLFGAATGVGKRLYYGVESIKLLLFERRLKHCSAIFPLSLFEKEYFERTYPSVPCHHLPCFFSFESLDLSNGGGGEEEKYILYHGNLSVEENSRAVRYIAQRIYPFVQDKGVKWVVAGSNPSETLKEELRAMRGVQLIENPDEKAMERWIGGAKVTLLVTFQTTGVKLKLLNSLVAGNYCLVNREMVVGSGLESLCEIAYSEREMIDLLNSLLAKEGLSVEERKQRVEDIKSIYRYQQSIEIIKSYCLSYGKNEID